MHVLSERRAHEQWRNYMTVEHCPRNDRVCTYHAVEKIVRETRSTRRRSHNINSAYPSSGNAYTLASSNGNESKRTRALLYSVGSQATNANHQFRITTDHIFSPPLHTNRGYYIVFRRLKINVLDPLPLSVAGVISSLIARNSSNIQTRLTYRCNYHCLLPRRTATPGATSLECRSNVMNNWVSCIDEARTAISFSFIYIQMMQLVKRNISDFRLKRFLFRELHRHNFLSTCLHTTHIVEFVECRHDPNP